MTIQNVSAVQADDETALRDAVKRTSVAWSAGDAYAFAAVFTEDTKVVISGDYYRGRGAVDAYMTAAFSGPAKGTNVVSDPVEISYLGGGAALIITEGGILAPGEAAVPPERALRATWVFNKYGEEWLISTYHSSPITKH